MNRILVIQDDAMNQDNLLRRLLRRGYVVAAFPEVNSALARARSDPFDLILIDLNLEDMDGWEAARRFAEDRATGRLPMIAMSNSELDGAEDMARDAGCVGFVPRPVELEALLPIIEGQLGEPGGA